MFPEYFDIVKTTKEHKVQHLYFEGRKVILNEDSCVSLIPHGFHKEVIIQGFLLRGNTVYSLVKSRRWLNKSTTEVVQRGWNLVAQGWS